MARLLQDTAGNSTSPEQLATVDSDFVVILASLLCALICVLGLIAVARCAWLRRLSSSRSTTPPPVTPRNPAANKGLKKKVLKALPRETFSDTLSVKFSECAICLTEFAAGDEIRVLPNCGHGFHVSCIDTWLGSHSSCPSCRQVLVVARCQKCGGLPPQVPTSTAAFNISSSSSSSAGAGSPEVRLKEREDERADRFLP